MVNRQDGSSFRKKCPNMSVLYDIFIHLLMEMAEWQDYGIQLFYSNTSNVLMEKLGLKAKEGFRRNYLHPAIEMGLIQMTLPDKPKSRNQRYV